MGKDPGSGKGVIKHRREKPFSAQATERTAVAYPLCLSEPLVERWNASAADGALRPLTAVGEAAGAAAVEHSCTAVQVSLPGGTSGVKTIEREDFSP